MESLASISLPIISLTCDAPAVHLKMAEQLSFQLDKFNTKINNPFSQDVSFMLDNCDVMKLMRNLIFDYQEIYDNDGNVELTLT
jgi:hypothetical protein